MAGAVRGWGGKFANHRHFLPYWDNVIVVATSSTSVLEAILEFHFLIHQFSQSILVFEALITFYLRFRITIAGLTAQDQTYE